MALENLTYLAKGGGCFLSGTLISTPTGDMPIETLKRGDKVVSLNEKSNQQEESTIGEIDILQRDAYYRINEAVNATAEHPFYTSEGIKKVKDLKVGDKLIYRDDSEVKIASIVRVEEEVTVYNLLNVNPNNNYFANKFLVHNKGCFLPDTRIRTPEGTKKIKDVRPGDTIVSRNDSSGAVEYSKVGSVQLFDVDDYYIINNTVKVTGDHPVYVEPKSWMGLSPVITKVRDLSIGQFMVTDIGTQEIQTLQKIDKEVTVYNLIDVVPNHNYYAGNRVTQYLVHNKGGGGCFLAGTQITMLNGNKSIEEIVKGERIWTLNEKTGITQPGIVDDVQVLEMPGYYIINSDIKTTEGHPFYTTIGIKKVVDLEVGDILLKNFDVKTPIKTIEYVEEKVTVYNLLNIEPNHNYLANGYLVHNKGSSGGGHSSSSSSGKSSSNSSSSKSSSSSSSSAPKVGTSTAKPGAKVKGADGKEVTSSTKTPSKSSFKTSTGVVGDNGYSPRFQGGYSAPAGSVVYQRDNNFMDYFFLAYLFNNNNPARPENQETVIVQPDGKEVTAKPVTDGMDGMMVLNWIIFGIFCIAIVGGVIWAVNKWTNR